MKRIGIYVSAFDPIHKGHLSFADKAVNMHGLDKLYFLVEPAPKYQQGVKAFDHRVNMAILGVANSPRLGTIVIKSKSDLAEYIQLLQSRFIGQKLAIIVPDYALKRFFRLPNLLSIDFASIEIIVGLSNQSADEVNLRLKLLSDTSGLKFRYSWFQANDLFIDSSNVKKKLKQGIKPEEVPAEVYEYIVSEKLYASSSA